MLRLGGALVCSILFAACASAPASDGGAPFDAAARDAGDPRDAGDRSDGGDASTEPSDGGVSSDGAAMDAAAIDAAAIDAGEVSDAGAIDGGTSEMDAGTDAGRDAGTDAGRDAGTDAGRDAGTDAGRDAGTDAGRDAGGGDCISGATGTHAVRFRWAGSGPSSTAYVVYERNQLPDTSRWHVGAYSMSIGYTPVFDDVFLGEGGLDLGGTVFIDVELSTMGLTSLRNVTISVYGRSFNTTASGSFRWQTFDGTGASPASSLANSAPYEWYPADATAAFSPGDGGILLRLRAGPASNRIVVNRVEICFDAS
jgi:hypothetical protein